MLDPHADGKGLLFHGDAGFMEHAEGIPRTVTHCQNQGLARQFCQPVILQITDRDALNASIAAMHCLHSGAEPHFTAQTDDLLTDVLHYDPQQIRPDVGPLLI